MKGEIGEPLAGLFFPSGNAARSKALQIGVDTRALEKQIWLPRSNPRPFYRDVLPLDSASTPFSRTNKLSNQERMNKGRGPAGENDIVVDVRMPPRTNKKSLMRRAQSYNALMNRVLYLRNDMWAPPSAPPTFVCYMLLSYYINGHTFRVANNGRMKLALEHTGRTFNYFLAERLTAEALQSPWTL